MPEKPEEAQQPKTGKFGNSDTKSRFGSMGSYTGRMFGTGTLSDADRLIGILDIPDFAFYGQDDRHVPPVIAGMQWSTTFEVPDGPTGGLIVAFNHHAGVSCVFGISPPLPDSTAPTTTGLGMTEKYETETVEVPAEQGEPAAKLVYPKFYRRVALPEGYRVVNMALRRDADGMETILIATHSPNRGPNELPSDVITMGVEELLKGDPFTKKALASPHMFSRQQERAITISGQLMSIAAFQEGYVLSSAHGHAEIYMRSSPYPRQIAVMYPTSREPGAVYPVTVVAATSAQAHIQLCAAADSQGDLTFIDLSEGLEDKVHAAKMPITALAFAPGGTFVAFATGYDWSHGAEKYDKARFRPGVWIQKVPAKLMMPP
jgi:hypothetical protein